MNFTDPYAQTPKGEIKTKFTKGEIKMKNTKGEFETQITKGEIYRSVRANVKIPKITKGFRPHIAFGRIEFAMLAFDQIFTQAGRWEYSFGGNYNCPITRKCKTKRRKEKQI